MAQQRFNPNLLVPMPETDMYKTGRFTRDDLVRRFGDATVTRAEIASILNIMYAVGMTKASEFKEIMVAQCQRIENERRGQAKLDEDRG